MTDREQVIQRLRKCQEDDDKEQAHIMADDILRTLLVDLGFENIVREYDIIDKRYA